jgi:Fe-S cluster assembly iron-binding protein IscA
MLAMTQEAADAVESIVAHANLPDSAVIRIAAGEDRSNGSTAVREQQLELVPEPAAQDLVVQEARIAVEPRSLQFLDDKVLDVERAGDRVEFLLYRQPEAEGPPAG